METKPLLYGLIGFFIGGLIVAVAATTINSNNTKDTNSMSASMQASTDNLSKKTGDEFDKAFIEEMIMHHQGAIDMAKLAEKNAKHDEVKQLSKDIISAQEGEISEMRQWQMNWGYMNSGEMNHSGHSM
jgi:uncharacterized protein (DUF305 family)